MKIVEVRTGAGRLDSLLAASEQVNAQLLQVPQEDSSAQETLRVLVEDAQLQATLDRFSALCAGDAETRILVQPVEAVLPRTGPREADPRIVSREALFDQIERGARPDLQFVVLVILATLVASIGLLEDNVAVVIGAMVIAPLLGPNLGLALAAALGDRRLMSQAIGANLLGLSLTFSMAWLMGRFYPLGLDTLEIASRTQVGLSSVVLALASGVAAVLSLVSGLSSTLVGVMVAVALLPPAVVSGLLLGSGEFKAALVAGVLLATNIICVNLSAQFVFLVRGVRPRTWLEQRAARQSAALNLAVWLTLLAGLLAILVLGRDLLGQLSLLPAGSGSASSA